MHNSNTCNFSNNIIKVTTNDYGGVGFTLYSSDCNIFSKNHLENTKKQDHGFFLTKQSNGNIIKNNVILKFTYGIRLFYGSNENIITYNTIDNNSKYGIYIESPSDENTITNNLITNNSHYGIYIQKTSNGNRIYHNIFINNNHHANNKGENQWDDGRYGNYWDNYEEKYPEARKTLRGTWNMPYEINNNGTDRYPLVDENSNYLEKKGYSDYHTILNKIIIQRLITIFFNIL
jgi:parallel beta-helix repeat protein